MKVGDHLRNVHTHRVTEIKAVETIVVNGEEVKLFTISSERFDRDDVRTEDEMNEHWEVIPKGEGNG